MKTSPLATPFESVDGPQVILNRRQESKQRTRERVLSAGRELFAEVGYEAATVRDIAKRAGMSTGAVFANFTDKADLFESVTVTQAETLLDAMREAAAVSGPAEARLASVIRGAYAQWAGNPPLIQAIAAQSWTNPANDDVRARGAIRALQSVLRDVLIAGVEAGELRKNLDVRLASETIWDAMRGGFRRSVADGLGPDALAARADAIVALMVSGLRA